MDTEGEAFLEELDSIDPSWLRPGFGMERALLILNDHFARRVMMDGSMSLLVLLDLLMTFDTVDYGVFLEWLAGGDFLDSARIFSSVAE